MGSNMDFAFDAEAHMRADKAKSEARNSVLTKEPDGRSHEEVLGPSEPWPRPTREERKEAKIASMVKDIESQGRHNKDGPAEPWPQEATPTKASPQEVAAVKEMAKTLCDSLGFLRKSTAEDLVKDLMAAHMFCMMLNVRVNPEDSTLQVAHLHQQKPSRERPTLGQVFDVGPMHSPRTSRNGWGD